MNDDLYELILNKTGMAHVADERVIPQKDTFFTSYSCQPPALTIKDLPSITVDCFNNNPVPISVADFATLKVPRYNSTMEVLRNIRDIVDCAEGQDIVQCVRDVVDSFENCLDDAEELECENDELSRRVRNLEAELKEINQQLDFYQNPVTLSQQDIQKLLNTPVRLGVNLKVQNVAQKPLHVGRVSTMDFAFNDQ